MARTAKRYRNPGGAGEKPSLSVGIYSRLSVDNHDHKAESVENQIEMINQFISSNNSNPDREMNFIVYDTYVDRGISGTSFDRNGFERLMQDVRERQVNCIIVKDLSRFGRDYLETGNLIEKILPFIGCRFIAVSDHFDSMAEDVNEGRLAMNIKNLVNDMYAKDISKRVAIARGMSAESGLLLEVLHLMVMRWFVPRGFARFGLTRNVQQLCEVFLPYIVREHQFVRLFPDCIRNVYIESAIINSMAMFIVRMVRTCIRGVKVRFHECFKMPVIWAVCSNANPDQGCMRGRKVSLLQRKRTG